MPDVFILCPLPLYFVFKSTSNKRNELAHPVMGTIFLVVWLTSVLVCGRSSTPSYSMFFEDILLFY